MNRLTLLVLLILLCVATRIQAEEINVCVPRAGEGNVTFFNYATTKTKLICDSYGEIAQPTLPELYQDGWYLIQVIEGATIAVKTARQYRPPIYYLGRLKSPRKK